MKRSESVMTGSDGNASDETKKKFVTNFTKYSLLNAIKDKSMIISKEETFTVIKDKYPKVLTIIWNKMYYKLIIVNTVKTVFVFIKSITTNTVIIEYLNMFAVKTSLLSCGQWEVVCRRSECFEEPSHPTDRWDAN